MNFYVYEHVRRDTGATFYVGKGQGSRAHKLGAANKGRVHTAETRARISAAATGRVHSTETRAKMTASQKTRHAKRKPKQD